MIGRGVRCLFLFILMSTCCETLIAGKLRVFVGIPPLEGLVERVGGDRIVVHCLLGPGSSPHGFEPTPRLLASLAQADVILTVGLAFEEALVTASRPSITTAPVINVAQDVSLRMVEGDGGCLHHDGDDHHRCGTGSHDPHVWLSPQNLIIMAQIIADTLSRFDSDGAAWYEDNLVRVTNELDELQSHFEGALLPYRGQRIVVHHPAFGYFTDEFGLEQIPVEMGGREPGPRHVAHLIRTARSLGIGTVFVQPQTVGRSAQTIATALGGRLVELDPLPRDPVEGLRTIGRILLSEFGDDDVSPR